MPSPFVVGAQFARKPGLGEAQVTLDCGRGNVEQLRHLLVAQTAEYVQFDDPGPSSSS